ncbi:DNA mismatch repair protein MutT [Candidatus Woesearchaeota archaeon CG10_big_fil_rev_8_21_14_0_10_44_13]|nr:MAG: DNA mismatch repair protein MutT [Candidatus Woesearchaeota archaeon CG10_big_fil_rev_8_21_14_0_10_44_13]
MCEEIKRPLVGMGVIVRKDGKVLLSRRKNAHGAGTWCFPGGHLELNETFEECAARETFEEAGIRIKNIRFITTTNDIMEDEDRHYVTIYVVADHESGEPKVMEPEKSGEWGWFSWDRLPKPLFTCMENLLKQDIDPFRL